MALARVAAAAGVDVMVVAPSKTPRARGDRVKNDRKDAELLARLLLAGELRPVTVPPDWLEAIRHLARAREQVRRDLSRARQRVSKLLLVEGRVYPGVTTWNQEHRRWLAAQQFRFESTELAFIDLLAAVDGLIARREVLDERLSRLALDERLWPTVSRLRAFRGVDTLTALLLHLELGGDWHRFRSPRQLGSWLGLTPSLDQSGESLTPAARSPRPAPAIARRLLVEAAWHYLREPRIGVTLKNRQSRPARPCAADRLARTAPPAPHPPTDALPRQTRQRRDRCGRPRARRVSSGPPRPRHELDRQYIAVNARALVAGQRPPASAIVL